MLFGFWGGAGKGRKKRRFQEGELNDLNLKTFSSRSEGVGSFWKLPKPRQPPLDGSAGTALSVPQRIVTSYLLF